MDRSKLTFKYFFNAGLDKTKYFLNARIDNATGECDVEGTNVYEDGHYIGQIKWVTPNEIEGMEDDELEKLFAENEIFSNYF